MALQRRKNADRTISHIDLYLIELLNVWKITFYQPEMKRTVLHVDSAGKTQRHKMSQIEGEMMRCDIQELWKPKKTFLFHSENGMTVIKSSKLHYDYKLQGTGLTLLRLSG